MLIQRDERLSTASRPRRAAARDGWSRRTPRDWHKPVRLVLYAVLALLGGAAALGGAALLLLPPAAPPSATPHPDSPPLTGDVATAPLPAAAPPEQPAAPVQAAPPPAASPPTEPPQAQAAQAAPAQAVPAHAVPALVVVAPTAASPAAPAQVAPKAAAAAAPAGGVPPEDAARVAALERQLRSANATLAALHAQAEEARRTAAPSQPPAPSADTAAAWADAERIVQALASHAAPPPAKPPAPDDAEDVAVPPYKPPLVFPPAPAAAAASAPVASTQTVLGEFARPATAQRPRVFLHYRAGSGAGQQAANEIAQRLLFSDFAYAETRAVSESPHLPSVRFFYPEDAAAAARLAALLGGVGVDFQVQDFSGQRGRAAHGTLEVWLPG